MRKLFLSTTVLLSSAFVALNTVGQITGQQEAAKTKQNQIPQKKTPAQPPKKVPNPNSDVPEANPKKKPITATDPATIKVPEDFKVELIYTVPKDTQGSWVNLCHDPKGRIIVSDQYGGLFRVTPPKIGEDAKSIKIEKIPAEIGAAQGLLWAFDSLYVVCNGNFPKPGLYRVTSSKNDDQLDKVETLRTFEGAGGEHGVHAVLPHPDGKRLTIVCGNQTKLTNFNTSKPMPVWGEDHLLPRMPDGRGFMKGVIGPGGAIYNISPDGKNWELFSVGFRNQYDAAYNNDGELFTYDADMEWDFNTPWYRPTRVCLVTSGSEFGWRNGAGKYPAYYADSLPAVDDIGPGSPTGICFGYGAKFPHKFQNRLFICDWSYGKMYACRIVPNGASYTSTHEEFISGTPLPLTDVIINPIDGAMYFTIGGRKTQSGLYRVTYTGKMNTEPYIAPKNNNSERETRLVLESMHTKKKPLEVLDTIWKSLGSTDRWIRFSARVALEHQDVTFWRDRALNEREPITSMTSLLALIRVTASCPEHAKTKYNENTPKADSELGELILKSLNSLKFKDLTIEQRLEMIRTYHVFFNRYGKPSDENRKLTIQNLDAHYPTGNRYVDGELSQVLVYLDSPTAASKTVKLLNNALTQEEQIEYARSLRMLKSGWTYELRKQYFEWFVKSENYKGGMSFGGFLKQVKDDAVAQLPAEDKEKLKSIIEAKPAANNTIATSNRPFVKNWTMDDLSPKLETALASGRNFEKGKKTFAAVSCFGCHRFDNEGGLTGPDLTIAAGRFSPRDLLESIINPSKEISDQYAAVDIETTDGQKISGRIINLNGDGITIMTDMLDPSSTKAINRANIESQKLSKLSMMPTGLLDTLKEDEIFDLLAYVLSKADPKHKMFEKK